MMAKLIEIPEGYLIVGYRFNNVFVYDLNDQYVSQKAAETRKAWFDLLVPELEVEIVKSEDLAGQQVLHSEY